MPFKVKFEIFEPGKIAPCFTTENRALAHVELSSIQQKRGYELTRMVPTITPFCLTGPETFLFLVYRVRTAQRKYWGSMGKVDKDVEIEYRDKARKLERQLDLKIANARFYLQGHPKSTPSDEKAFAFFIVVEAWREKMKAYYREKRSKGPDDTDVKDLRDECFDLSNKIDDYCIRHIGL